MHTAFGSFNPTDHDLFFDGWLIPTVNGCTSFFAGFAVFSVLGYLAHQQGCSVEDLDTSGFALAFIAYPSALAVMPASNFFSILFFFMLLLLAIDSQFSTTESVIVMIEDFDEVFCLYPQWFKTSPNRRFWVTFFVCFISWLLGFAFICRGGYYLLSVIDGISTGLPMFIIGAAQLGVFFF